MSTGTNTAAPWVLCFKRRPAAALRLFCFHHVGGNASFFNRMHMQVPENVEVRPIQLPGRMNRHREPKYMSMQPLVTDLVNAFQRSNELEGDFVFFGHSFGGLVAFEVAHELRNRGLPLPRLLMVSCRAAPHRPNTLRPLRMLPDLDFVDAMADYYEAQPDLRTLPAELREMAIPVMRADMTVHETYECPADREPLPLRIVAVMGEIEKSMSENEKMLALTEWERHSSVSFRSEVVPGNHFHLAPGNPKARVYEMLREELRSIVGLTTSI